MKKVGKELLKKFCSKKSANRPAMETPFTRGGYTCATNGHVAIAIKGGIKYPSNRKAPDVLGLIKQSFNDGITGHFVALGAFEMMKEQNNADRMVLMTVPGDDEVTYFDNNYLALLGQLPNCYIAARRYPAYALIKFEGGHGILAPMVGPKKHEFDENDDKAGCWE